MLSAIAGLVMFGFTAVYVAIALWLYFYRKRRLLAGLVEFSSDYSWVQKHLLSEMNLPYALADEKGRILWKNQKFQETIADLKGTKKNLTVLFPDITREILSSGQKGCIHVTYEDRKFRVDLCPVDMNMEPDEEQELELDESQEKMVAVYLFDETRMLQYEQEINDQKMVSGLIYLDNYDEALESVEEVRRSLLVALIDRKVSKYISGVNGIVKKMEKDKYFFTIKQRYVDRIQEERFSLLEDVKTVNIGNEMAVTLSIGMGMNGESYSQCYDYARAAIDMALGRGGDQAAVKTKRLRVLRRRFQGYREAHQGQDQNRGGRFARAAGFLFQRPADGPPLCRPGRPGRRGRPVSADPADGQAGQDYPQQPRQHGQTDARPPAGAGL